MCAYNWIASGHAPECAPVGCRSAPVATILLSRMPSWRQGRVNSLSRFPEHRLLLNSMGMCASCDRLGSARRQNGAGPDVISVGDVNRPRSALVTRSEAERQHANLSSVIRLYVLDHYMALAK